jgi:DoxX-like protein
VVIARIIVSVLLAALLCAAAVRKLSHTDEVERSYLRAGVPADKLNRLAAILLAGAAGLIAGLFWTPIGIAAAGGLVAYFLIAIGFHFRAKDIRRAGTPLAFAMLATATLLPHLV